MNAALAYQQASVDTAPPGHLIVMMYDRVLTALDRVEDALDGPRPAIETAHDELTRAQEILAELLSSLNPEAGEIVPTLASIYEFCHHRLVEANLLKETGPLGAVRSIFEDLRGAWATIVEQGAVT